MGQSAKQFEDRYQNEVKHLVTDAVLDQRISIRIAYAKARELENLKFSSMAQNRNVDDPKIPPIKADPKPGDGEEPIDPNSISNPVVKQFVIDLEAFIDTLFA